MQDKKEKMVKIIAVSGLTPREFIDKDSSVYIHEDEVTESIDAKGNLIKATFAVYNIPEALAKFKLSEMPDRYKLFGVSKTVRFPSITPQGARTFCEVNPVEFKMYSKAVIDPNTGEPKTKRGSKEVVVQKYYLLVDCNGEKINAKPYKTEIVEPEPEQEEPLATAQEPVKKAFIPASRALKDAEAKKQKSDKK